jgi:hypothetical protein
MVYLYSLSLTLLVETFVYLWLKPKSYAFLFAILVMNMGLNLTMNFILMTTPNPDYFASLILYEVLTIVIEALILMMLGIALKKAILFSLIANLLSYFIGIGMNTINLPVYAYETIVLYSMIPITLYISFRLFQDFFKQPYHSKNKSGKK